MDALTPKIAYTVSSYFASEIGRAKQTLSVLIARAHDPLESDEKLAIDALRAMQRQTSHAGAPDPIEQFVFDCNTACDIRNRLGQLASWDAEREPLAMEFNRIHQTIADCEAAKPKRNYDRGAMLKRLSEIEPRINELDKWTDSARDKVQELLKLSPAAFTALQQAGVDLRLR